MIVQTTLSPLATEYYNSRVACYQQQGFAADEAKERADYDLIEWSKPLYFPEDEYTAEELDRLEEAGVNEFLAEI